MLNSERPTEIQPDIRFYAVVKLTPNDPLKTQPNGRQC